MRPRSSAIRARSIVSVSSAMRLAEVLDGAGVVDEALGEPERGREDRRRTLVLERLLGRAAEIRGSGVGIPLRERAVRGLPEDRHREVDRAGPREQQVRRDLLLGRVGLGEELGGRCVLVLALGAVQVRVDRGAEDRMDEGEPCARRGAGRSGRASPPCAQPARGRSRPASPRRRVRTSSPSTATACASAVASVGRRAKPEVHRARDRLGAELVDARRVPRLRGDALARERVEERSQEERVAAGRLVARVGELDVDVARERLADQRLRRVQRRAPAGGSRRRRDPRRSRRRSASSLLCAGGRVPAISRIGIPSSRRAV